MRHIRLTVVVSLLCAAPAALAEAPRLFFTDLTSAPNSGGETVSGFSGAYVTLYGNGFGATQGTSTVTLGGASYWVRSSSGDLAADNPFKLLASHPPEAGRGMTDYTLVVTGTPADDGGFLMLASSSAAGELLLDSTCAAVEAAP